MSTSEHTGEAPVWPRGARQVLALLWCLFWLLMIVVAVQDNWDEPQVLWWQPLLWEGSSALVISLLVALLLGHGERLRPLLGTPWRWFWMHLRWLPVFSTAFVLLTYGLRHAVYGAMGLRYTHAPWLAVWVYETIKMALFIGLWLGVIFGLHSFLAWRAEQLRLAAAERALAEARLQQLRAQLQPHFLFNTLNTVSAFMHTDVERADRLLARLAELLRGSLALGERAVVPLAEEVALARAYADIMLERCAPRVRLRWDIGEDALALQVPALLLQPLLENAFRHGVEPCTGTVVIAVRARVTGGALEIAVRDGAPEGSVRAAVAPGTGIGLANCRQRLQALYGDRARLHAGPVDGGWEVRLQLPASNA